MFLIIKYWVRRENIKFLHKIETTAIGKRFVQNRFLKAENIFLHTSIKISENSNITHTGWSKTDLSKETKENRFLRRDTL